MTDEKREKLTQMVEEFCDEYLNDDYKELSLKLIEKMALKKSIRYHKGKLEVWASAIIYSISQVNSLFDDSNEVHITRKDILNYFKASQTTVSIKAINLRDTFDMDSTFVLGGTSSQDLNEDLMEKMYSNLMDHNFGDEKDMVENNMTIDDYQKTIDQYKRKFGERFFKENEGQFWLIYETRPFMQCLLDQANLFWENDEEEKAIDQYKYMLKLNPNDNQGVRDILFPRLLELDRLDEAEKLYFKYESDFTAIWKYCKLLLDIKNNVPYSEIETEYKNCLRTNPYVVPYLLEDIDIPLELPYFYGPGDENEAIYCAVETCEAWWADKNAMKVLKKLSK